MTQFPDAPSETVIDAQSKTQVLNLDNNKAGLLCYAPFFIGLIASIIFVCTEPKGNKFVRFHAFQSLTLTVAGFAVCFGLGVLGFVGLGFLSSLLSPLVSLALIVACVVCMIQAWNGKMFKLPKIGDIASKLL